MALKNDKTSKTARVMNLLSKKPDPAASEEAAGADAPSIVSPATPDTAMSAQIKSALEDTLEGSPDPVQASPAPAPQPEPARQSAPAPQPEPEPAPVQQQAPAPAPAPVLPELEEAPPEVRFQEPLQPINPGYINVMQVLVEEKAPQYVKMFGLCDCERCMEDVKALTLNNLPSKYVVLEPGDRIPRLTVYEGRFASDITSQLLQACKMVMAHPHHGR